jgi:calcineurin-like phosphoesterase
MTGPINSCLGVRTELSIEKMRTKLPVRFATAEGPCAMDGVLFTLDDATGKCTAVKRIRV